MTRALMLPLAVILALATGLGLLGVAATLSQDPVVIAPAATGVTALAEATPGEDASPDAEPFQAEVPAQLPPGLAVIRVARLALAPGAVLAPERTSALTGLIAEVGVVGVRTYGLRVVGDILDGFQVDTVLRRGDHVLIGSGTVSTVRNAGPTPAVVLVVAIDTI